MKISGQESDDWNFIRPKRTDIRLPWLARPIFEVKENLSAPPIKILRI